MKMHNNLRCMNGHAHNDGKKIGDGGKLSSAHDIFVRRSGAADQPSYLLDMCMRYACKHACELHAQQTCTPTCCACI